MTGDSFRPGTALGLAHRTVAVDPAPTPGGVGPEDPERQGPDRRLARTRGPRPGTGGLAPLGFAAAAYLGLALVVWWNVWSSHPSTVTTCGCGDTSLFTWFLEWPAYALAHGLDPLYATTLFHPGGVNLLANTGVVAIGFVLAPVTWMFGPVASLNVALTLAPALSSLAAFVLLRRWVMWAPAAFAGGLLYGFSPFVLTGLTDSHLMIGMAAVPPLVVLALDELLIRQRRRPGRVGVVLGLLLAVQFFVGTEVLVITVAFAAFGCALVAATGAVRHRSHLDAIRPRVRHAALGLAAAAAVAGALLSYPTWFALAGPAHPSGLIWPGAHLSYGGMPFADYVRSSRPDPALAAFAHRVGGYQGPTYFGPAVGWGVVVVAVGGLAAFPRDRRLWLFGTVGVVAVVLARGSELHGWTPWRLFAGLPLVENVIPSRLLVVVDLAAAVMVAVTVDHARTSLRRRGVPWAGTLIGTTLATLAVVPLALARAPGLPFTTQTVVLPHWFAQVAPRLPGHQVLLVFPVPWASIQSAMTWQAVDGMHYAMVGGGGPGGVPSRAGQERAGQAVLARASFSFEGQKLHRGDIGAVRRALHGWGVTMVVIPQQPGLPSYDQVQSTPFAVAVVTAATGRAPRLQADAWVWSDVDHAGTAPSIAPSDVVRCARTAGTPGTAVVRSVAECVLAASRVPR